MGQVLPLEAKLVPRSSLHVPTVHVRIVPDKFVEYLVCLFVDAEVTSHHGLTSVVGLSPGSPEEREKVSLKEMHIE